MKNYEIENNGGSSFLMGIVCGAAVGAAVGLLLAPKSGAELRKQIYDSTDRLRRHASNEYDRAAETVERAVDDVVERGTKAVQQGRETYETVRQSAADALHLATSKATNGRP